MLWYHLSNFAPCLTVFFSLPLCLSLSIFCFSRENLGMPLLPTPYALENMTSMELLCMWVCMHVSSWRFSLVLLPFLFLVLSLTLTLPYSALCICCVCVCLCQRRLDGCCFLLVLYWDTNVFVYWPPMKHVITHMPCLLTFCLFGRLLWLHLSARLLILDE